MTRLKLPPDMPGRMKQLPRNSAGYPVPFFVEFIDGVPDFRVMNSDNLRRAIMEELCWICGHRLHRYMQTRGPRGTFVAGPMCLVNRTSAEPPSHEDCAVWSAKACPFLSNPNKVRREANLPDEWKEPGGIAIMRNPGVSALIASSKWAWFRPQHGEVRGVLCEMQRVDSVRWIAEGRPATDDEVLNSIDSGMGQLLDMAEQEGPVAVRALAHKTRDALKWVQSPATDYPVIRNVLSVL